MFEDLKYALRSFRTHKAFTATALLAVAVGIGSITAIFTVVNRTILRPLPFVAADRLVQIYGTPEDRSQSIAASDVEEFRTAATSFEGIAGYNVEGRYLQGSDALERVLTVDVEKSFFSMLGVTPLAGRTFLPDDLPNVAVA